MKTKPQSETKYVSPDGIVEVIATSNDARYPRHDAKMVIMKLNPKPHTRCRQQWGGVTFMFSHADLRAVLEATKSVDSSFDFQLSKAAKPKPEERREYWKQRNLERVRKNACR